MSEQSDKQGRIVRVSGPLVVAENMSGTRMYDVVRVSEQKLVGEIIELKGDLAWIQVYEETAGIGPGETVYLTAADESGMMISFIQSNYMGFGSGIY